MDIVNRDEARIHRIRHMVRDAALRETGLSYFFHLGIGITAATIISFIVWSYFARLDEAAVTQGQIIPSGKIRTVQHLEGGIISEIAAREGDLVQAGQLLVRMDGTSIQSEYQKLLLRKTALELQAERLSAFSEERKLNFPEVSKELRTLRDEEMKTFEAQKEDRFEQRNQIAQQILARTSEINRFRRQLKGKERLKQIAAEELKMFRTLLKNKNTSQLRVLQANRKFEEIEGEIVEMQGNFARLNEAIEELTNQRDSLDAQLRKNAREKLSEVQGEMAEIEKGIDSWGDKVQRLAVQAPVDGIIQNMPIKTVGGVIEPGGLVVEMVPLNEALVVESKLSPKDIGYVRTGQPVDVKVQTYDFARFGSIPGKVVSLSATTFTDAKSEPFYKAIIELEKNHVGDDPKKNILLPGMTVQADIKTGEKTVFEYFLKPIFTNLSEGLRER